MVMKKWNDYKLNNGWHSLAWSTYSKFRQTDGWMDKHLDSPKLKFSVRIQHPILMPCFFILALPSILREYEGVGIWGPHKVFL